MAQPTGGDLHVSRPLTNISVAYMQGNEDYVADQVFPPVPVSFKTDSYYVYNRGDWFRTQAQKRAPRTESAGTGWSVTSDTYKCEVQAVHVDVADEDRANQDRPMVDLDRDGTRLITADILLRRELDWVTTYFGASKWTGWTDQTGAATAATNQFIQWDRTSSTPVDDIRTWRTNMKEKTGLAPNKLVIGQRVEDGLMSNSDIMDRIKYTQRGVITRDLMSSLFGVQVLVPAVVQNTAEEGAASDSIGFIYGKEGLLVYAAPNPGLMVPTGGYTFEWTGFLGGDTRGTRVKKFRMEQLEADRLEVESAYDFKMVSADLGIFLKTVVQ